MSKSSTAKGRRSVLTVGLLFAMLLVASCSVIAQGVDYEEEYENYISIKLFPDESILMALKGGFAEAVSPSVDISAEDISLTLETSTEGDVTEIDSHLSVELSPSTYSSLADLDLDIEGHSDDTYTNLTLLVDYPGYVGLSGSVGIVIVDMMLAFLPILEAQMAEQVTEATDGQVTLERFEISDLVEGNDSASFTARLSLEGDVQEGLQAVAEGMGAEITQPEEPGEAAPLTIEAFDFHVSFDGSTLTLEVNGGGTVVGDFNGQLNNFKDVSLEGMLNNMELDEEERALIAQAMPIDLDALDTQLDVGYSVEDDEAAYTFSLEGLGLNPPSFETILVSLEEISKQEPMGDFMLVLEGESIENEYISFSVPGETKQPLVEEEQVVVWNLEDIENLEDVGNEVKTEEASSDEVNTGQGSNSTTIMVAAAAGLLIIGALAFLRMRQ
jgi:hypothetical protein